MSNIRILIADDHAIVRDGVRLLLQSQPDIEVVAEASNGKEALEQARLLLPDIVLMDIAMPVMNGLEATAAIKQELPEVKVLALTMHDDYEYFLELLHHGASGYVLKGASSTQLLAAIHMVHEGGVSFHAFVAGSPVADCTSAVSPDDDGHAGHGLLRPPLHPWGRTPTDRPAWRFQRLPHGRFAFGAASRGRSQPSWISSW